MTKKKAIAYFRPHFAAMTLDELKVFRKNRDDLHAYMKANGFEPDPVKSAVIDDLVVEAMAAYEEV